MSDYTLRLDDGEIDRYRMMASMARADEEARWAAAGIGPGARVADVGCGPGAVLAELADIVGPSGVAVGVEPDPVARQAARRYLDERGLEHVEVRDGTGEATGLTEASWDCVMMRHVLAHTGDAPPRIVGHLASLLRPGGHLYLIDVDFDAARTTPHDEDLGAQLERYVEFHRARGNDLRIGTRLPLFLGGAGLDVAAVAGWYAVIPAQQMRAGGPLQSAQQAMMAAGFLDEAEADRWAEARVRFASIDGALMWMPLFAAVGRKPAPGSGP